MEERAKEWGQAVVPKSLNDPPASPSFNAGRRKPMLGRGGSKGLTTERRNGHLSLNFISLIIVPPALPRASSNNLVGRRNALLSPSLPSSSLHCFIIESWLSLRYHLVASDEECEPIREHTSVTSAKSCKPRQKVVGGKLMGK